MLPKRITIRCWPLGRYSDVFKPVATDACCVRGNAAELQLIDEAGLHLTHPRSVHKGASTRRGKTKQAQLQSLHHQKNNRHPYIIFEVCRTRRTNLNAQLMSYKSDSQTARLRTTPRKTIQQTQTVESVPCAATS